MTLWCIIALSTCLKDFESFFFFFIVQQLFSLQFPHLTMNSVRPMEFALTVVSAFCVSGAYEIQRLVSVTTPFVLRYAWISWMDRYFKCKWKKTKISYKNTTHCNKHELYHIKYFHIFNKACRNKINLHILLVNFVLYMRMIPRVTFYLWIPL